MDSSSSSRKSTASPETERSAPTSASRTNDSNQEPSHQNIPVDSRAAADAEAKEMVKREFRMLQEAEEAEAKARINSDFRLLQDAEEDLAAFAASDSRSGTQDANQDEAQAGITHQDDTTNSQQAVKESYVQELTAAAMTGSANLAKGASNSENPEPSVIKQQSARHHEENGIEHCIRPLPTSVRRRESSPGAYAVDGPRNGTGNQTRNSSSLQEETSPNTSNPVEDQPSFATRNQLVEAHLVSENTDNNVELGAFSEEPPKSRVDSSSSIVVAQQLSNTRTRLTIVVLVLVCVVLLVIVVSLLAGREGGEVGSSDRGNSQDDVEDEGDLAYPCFQSNEELKAAVHRYHQDNSPNADVSLKYGWPIGSWCVTPVKQFAQVFLVNENEMAPSVSDELFNNMAYFHEDIGGWDMSNALEMEEMLRGVKNLSSSWGVQRWNTSSMTSLKALFMGTNWTEPVLDLGAWDISRVETLNQLFRWSTVSTPNVSGWDTSNVHHIGQLADGASNFNDDISNWNTQNVAYMYRAFKGASNFQGDLSRWNTSSVVKMEWAFEGASSFNSDISRWDVSRVDYMLEAFKDSAFNQDISSWNISSVTDLRNLFFGASSFRQDLCAWGSRLLPTANISGMFVGTSCPNQTDPVIPHGPFCFNCD